MITEHTATPARSPHNSIRKRLPTDAVLPVFIVLLRLGISILTAVMFFVACAENICYGDSPPSIASDGTPSVEIDPTRFGAKGDGMTDDTVPLQKALTLCSRNGLKCTIPRGKQFLVKAPLFMWGKAILQGEGDTSTIAFDVHDAPYLLNIGISGRNRLEKPFAGKISNVTFKIDGGEGGRILYFWRTDGAQIIDNVFDAGVCAYSATSSGNDQRWVMNGLTNCIRKNVVIKGNIIRANAASEGSEGIGLGDFDGALIQDNQVIGVGDDPIGIHFCKNIRILNNDLKSVRGRIYVSNSKDVEIAYNRAERMPSGQDQRFYGGIALLYIGFETEGANEFWAPTNIQIHDNTLIFPEGSIDGGGAIYLYGLRNVSIEHNRVINNSAGVKAAGLRLLPRDFSGRWRDPDRIDPTNVARVWGVNIIGNTMEGKYPLSMIMTGNCVDYKGEVIVKDNSAADFGFYCETVSLIGNTRIGNPQQ